MGPDDRGWTTRFPGHVHGRVGASRTLAGAIAPSSGAGGAGLPRATHCGRPPGSVRPRFGCFPGARLSCLPLGEGPTACGQRRCRPSQRSIARSSIAVSGCQLLRCRSFCSRVGLVVDAWCLQGVPDSVHIECGPEALRQAAAWRGAFERPRRGRGRRSDLRSSLR